MRALAYLLGGRALDVARDAEAGIRWPKPEVGLLPMATTAETAAAWRRWRENRPVEGSPSDGTRTTRALRPSGI